MHVLLCDMKKKVCVHMQYLFELSKIVVVALIVLLQLVLPSGECMMQVRGTHSHVIASTSSCISFKVFLVSLWVSDGG